MSSRTRRKDTRMGRTIVLRTIEDIEEYISSLPDTSRVLRSQNVQTQEDLFERLKAYESTAQAIQEFTDALRSAHSLCFPTCEHVKDGCEEEVEICSRGLNNPERRARVLPRTDIFGDDKENKQCQEGISKKRNIDEQESS